MRAAVYRGSHDIAGGRFLDHEKTFRQRHGAQVIQMTVRREDASEQPPVGAAVALLDLSQQVPGRQ